MHTKLVDKICHDLNFHEYRREIEFALCDIPSGSRSIFLYYNLDRSGAFGFEAFEYFQYVGQPKVHYYQLNESGWVEYPVKLKVDFEIDLDFHKRMS